MKAETKKTLKEIGTAVGNLLAVAVLIAMLIFFQYMHDLSKYGSAGVASSNVLGVKVIYPIPGTPDCHIQETTAELVETKAPGFFTTHYYLKFTVEGVPQKAFEVYSKDVVYFSPENLYSVTVCDGEIYTYKANGELK